MITSFKKITILQLLSTLLITPAFAENVCPKISPGDYICKDPVANEMRELSIDFKDEDKNIPTMTVSVPNYSVPDNAQNNSMELPEISVDFSCRNMNFKTTNCSASQRAKSQKQNKLCDQNFPAGYLITKGKRVVSELYLQDSVSNTMFALNEASKSSVLVNKVNIKFKVRDLDSFYYDLQSQDIGSSQPINFKGLCVLKEVLGTDPYKMM